MLSPWLEGSSSRKKVVDTRSKSVTAFAPRDREGPATQTPSMGCDIHLTMERRVWLLDAASLAALSLLRMLHLRTASEQLEVEVESPEEQTAVLRVLQSPELLECIARSVSLVCADRRSNLGPTVISTEGLIPRSPRAASDEQAGWAKVSYLHQIFSPASIASKMRTAFAASAEEHFERIESNFFEEQADLGDDEGAIMDRWVCGHNADAARYAALSAAAHVTQAMLDPSLVPESEIVVDMEAVITDLGLGMPTDNRVQCTVVEWLEGPSLRAGVAGACSSGTSIAALASSRRLT